MQVPPSDLPTTGELTEVVATTWGITAATVEFIPAGLDTNAASFAMTGGDGRRWLLKVRADRPRPASTQIPIFLRQSGLREVVAAEQTLTGQAFAEVGHAYALLYPYVDAGNVWTAGLSHTQWHDLGAFLGQTHRTVIPPEIAAAVPVDGYRNDSPTRVRSLADRLNGANTEVSTLWSENRDVLRQLTERIDALGAELRRSRPPRVLCHGDLHGGNVLARPDGPIWVVDWDSPLFAPPERDLVFVFAFPFGDPPSSPEALAAFGRGYGGAATRPDVLAYYAYERVLDDVIEFTRHLLEPGIDPADRAESLHWLRAQFIPGGGAELAQRIDPGVD